jgi:thiosulfate/3-mercaptopyruvate sulfurtransferase
MRSLAYFLMTIPLVAQDGMLIQGGKLAGMLQEPGLVILHTGTAKDYAEGHIPGARLVTLADLSVMGPNELRLELPPVEKLRESLMKLGVKNDSKVVVYAGNESIQSATRVWFTFDYLGLNAALLDGGVTLWKAEGRALESNPAKFEPSKDLKVEAHPEALITMSVLENSLKQPAMRLVDARLPEFYTGANKGMMVRGGRIPGANNVPFPSLLDSSTRFLPAAELSGKLGGAETLVTYCHIGQQATVPYFAARLAGRKRGAVKLYDGSFQEWSGRAEMPVETDAK